MSKDKNIMIREDLFVRLCMYLLQDDPDPAERWALVDEMQDKIDRICRRREYSASLSAGFIQGRHAPVRKSKPASKEEL